jgi:hypothetical protein
MDGAAVFIPTDRIQDDELEGQKSRFKNMKLRVLAARTGSDKLTPFFPLL